MALSTISIKKTHQQLFTVTDNNCKGQQQPSSLQSFMDIILQLSNSGWGGVCEDNVCSPLLYLVATSHAVAASALFFQAHRLLLSC